MGGILRLLDTAKAKSQTQPSAPANILVIDDEENIRMLYELHLKKIGYRSVSASNGDDAITQIKQAELDGTNVDVAIVDLSIPGSSGGIELAKQIQSKIKIDFGVELEIEVNVC